VNHQINISILWIPYYAATDGKLCSGRKVVDTGRGLARNISARCPCRQGRERESPHLERLIKAFIFFTGIKKRLGAERNPRQKIARE
jgi:hypothetical protein